MFKALFDLAKDVIDVADAAVSIPVTFVRAATKPIADAAKSIKEEVEDLFD